MRAVVHDRYGPPEVLRVEDAERPFPTDNEVLVRIHATTVTRTDCAIRAARPFIWRFFAGIRRPRRRILGIELAGEVAAVGAAVSEFEVGDEVFGGSPGRFGAHAEFVSVPESGALAHKPSGLSYDDAAAVCDGFVQAASAVRTAELQKGQRILVYGASGSLGTAAVQLARQLGAHVTAVCGTKNVELVRSLGADEVVDYQAQDYTRNGKTYDVILDAVGFHHFSQCRGSIVRGGIFVPTELGRFHLENLLLTLATKLVGRRRVRFGVARWSKRDVLRLKELIDAGEYRAVIDRSYPLEDVVEATRYVETLQKTGNVVLTLNA
ncbi:MAG TPA: NAD(P)-dependent alcohol dehydrogenase [Gaiellaceae bacterium]|nr:NAD(P)-dependent alcohol dehydrogenase [Gaiellaceae bacterium]